MSTARVGTWLAADGVLETTLRGRQVFTDPRLNRGTAFTVAERDALGLIGLMPPRVLTLDEQIDRAYAQYCAQPTNLAKNVNLNELHDRNEVLYYALLSRHLREMLPIVYTPTIGEAIERYSHEYRRPRGVYLSVDEPELVERSLLAPGLGPDDVDLIVATDAEAILGIGDWGVGGISIATGKLAVYTAAAGIDPHRCMAVMLDVGTNRDSLQHDPLYLGLGHPRVDVETYDRFVDTYVRTAHRLFPSALLHWEDFAAANARRILDRYRGELATFNDDTQGTGAINLAATLGAVRASGIPLEDNRIVIYGAGTAGMGVADQLADAMVEAGLAPGQASSRFWAVDRQGLLVDSMTELAPFQRRFARPAHEVAGWGRTAAPIGLEEVVRRVHPTVLIGTSTHGGAFTETIVREMAAHTARPAILPMSNPTALAEAVPRDLLRWSDGRALIATGSPFDPVTHDRVTYAIGQANNALVFPGLGLGAIVAGASRITDSMVLAAARAVADLVDPTVPGASLLPQVEDLRATSMAVATAVVEAAKAAGVAQAEIGSDVAAQVAAAMWTPVYRPVRAV